MRKAPYEQRTKIRIRSQFSSSLQATQRPREQSVNTEIKKKSQHMILYLIKLSFENEGKTFIDKKKTTLRELLPDQNYEY